MLVCKYTKKFPANYIPHLDILRQVGMTIRRADIAVAYSEGFNPHMRIFFSAPLPLGTMSESEYFVVDTQTDGKEFLERFNAKAPNGIVVTRVANTDKSSIHALLYAADYIIDFDGIESNALEDYVARLMGSAAYIIQHKGKDKDIRPLILEADTSKNILKAKLRFGNVNLSAQALAADIISVCGDFGANCIITKLNSYAKPQDILVDMDKIIFQAYPKHLT